MGRPLTALRSEPLEDRPLTNPTTGILRARRQGPRGSTAECGQQFPPSDGDCHTPPPVRGA